LESLFNVDDVYLKVYNANNNTLRKVAKTLYTQNIEEMNLQNVEVELDTDIEIKPLYMNEPNTDSTDLRKLDVGHLRAMVIQRGMDQKEAKKLKKTELISILEA
jgi:hypothetical protein